MSSSSSSAVEIRSRGPAAASLAAFVGVVTLALATATGSGAQCVRGTISCMNDTMAAQRTCTATVMCTGLAGTGVYVGYSMGSNVLACLPSSFTAATPVTLTLAALASTVAPPTRACTWVWSTELGSDGTISLTTADGLPVELMDFSIDESASEDPE